MDFWPCYSTLWLWSRSIEAYELWREVGAFKVAVGVGEGVDCIKGVSQQIQVILLLHHLFEALQLVLSRELSDEAGESADFWDAVVILLSQLGGIGVFHA